jgi:hypothetical protein
MNVRGFTDLKSLEGYSRKQATPLPLVTSKDPVTLKFSTLQKFEITTNDKKLLELRASKHTYDATESNISALERANLYQNNYQPVLIVQKTSQSIDNDLPDKGFNEETPTSYSSGLPRKQCVVSKSE